MDHDQAAEPDTGGIPLPRRGPRRSDIVRARERLYGDDSDDGPVGWADVEGRERSAALARAVSTRRHGEDAHPTGDEASGDTGDAVSTPDPVSVDLPPPGSRAGADESLAPPTPAPEPRAGADESPAPPTPVPKPRPGSGGPGRRRAVVVAVAVAVVLLAFVAGTLVGRLAAPSAPPSAPTVAAGPPPLPSQPTLSGDVVRVRDGGTLTVLVGDRGVDVAVLGLDAPLATDPTPQACGADAATTFATDTLVGRRVTLVPDPAGPEFDAAGRRWAYVVLETQQNYTDLALLEGIGRWDTTRAVTYGQVFAREEATARSASTGIWGDPCRAVR
jgi:endonuclease YncB( thermonuclease family)